MLDKKRKAAHPFMVPNDDQFSWGERAIPAIREKVKIRKTLPPGEKMSKTPSSVYNPSLRTKTSWGSDQKRTSKYGQSKGVIRGVKQDLDGDFILWVASEKWYYKIPVDKDTLDGILRSERLSSPQKMIGKRIFFYEGDPGEFEIEFI